MAALLLVIVLMATTVPHHVSSFTSNPARPSSSSSSRGANRINRGGTTIPLPQLFQPLYSTKESNTNTIDINNDGTLISTTTNNNNNRVSISKPPIHWTVPNFKVGYQDPITGQWFDEDGPRNGPPQNYWRQSADEREYNDDMSVVDAVLSSFDIESKVQHLEHRCSVRRPSLSRKMLGVWAPIMLGGDCMAYDDRPFDDGGMIEIPFLVEIRRSQGRRFGPKNHYGIFDLKLQSGEDLAVVTTNTNTGEGDDDDGSSMMISAKIKADEKNEPMDLGKVMGREEGGADADTAHPRLQFGGITYLSDYAMVQRRPDGAIDFFLRVDRNYLGATKEDKARYHLV
eukprot:CAMPEP_0196143110 /NCGR_PEP_ID=MMETSP0910-20130528/12629_1 /TAXON_ID=49265 /ORGANISM="Thalassiosira rotula, Strain GSO102" /LENGTH=341 /DNA_ID=CAMNT_0041404503 /DNA_START=87 /DNA_END=1112 /DNA_ORIENTATION=-